MAREKKPKQERPARKGHTKWLAQMFYKPRTTLAKVAAEETSIKAAPLLLISLMVILAVLISAPIKTQQLQMGATLPENFEYWSEEQQMEYMQAQQNQTSPIFMILTPALSGILGYLIFSMLMASILYLALTLAGSRAPRLKIGNLVAWSMLPFALRELVKLLVAGFSKKLVTQPGLSNLVDAEANGLISFLRSILANVDLYWLLFVILLVIGGGLVSGLKKKKAVWTTLISVLIMLLLQGLPGLLRSLLSGLSTGGIGFYF